MAQANSNNSTRAPVDTTRRRFLAVAAGASFVSATALAGAAMALSVPAAVTVPSVPAIAEPTALHDPMFGLIEAHRKAGRDHEAALVEQERLERIGDKAADWAGEAPCHAEFKAFDVLLAAAATTLPGILAKLAYLQDVAERDVWMFDDRTGSATLLLEGFAASIANVSAVLS